ncbi:FadR/GntR family transcriptional regulator [Salipiger mucosus]|uniref:Transcriptional regulator, GntR family n=1 Tax=Salipiger mucosus DSM 16094 TaxID=1123237 RepID=S9QGM7_9RHOB|nr:FadR/GntR family transcriptional regulator [Salipiger mucosus]EPX78753.1 Transcriptional regulator, GntR family [Salipiger mucosus DSM 16094]
MTGRREAGAAQRKSLSDVVFDKLHRAIKSGAYAPDEKLPTEHDLAAEFEVSRPVIRDALRKLRDQRLIYSRQGAGSFVRQLGTREPLGFGQLQNLADLKRCYEFRLVLEPAAAEMAAERRSSEDLAGIEAALRVMQDATARSRHREDADFEFHHAISVASGNDYFSTAMDALKEHIAVGMQFHGLSLKQTAGGLDHVYGEHLAIFEAIRDGEADQARLLMRAHLLGSRARLFEG